MSLLEGVRDRWRISGVRGIWQGPPNDSRIRWKAAGVEARRYLGPLEDIMGVRGIRQGPAKDSWIFY
jgi:hypothetical protein